MGMGAADTGGDTGADSSVDTSGGDAGSSEGATSEGGTEFGGGTSTGTTAAEKLRLKWRGIEEEIDDPRKLAERFSDEYEFEFTGPGRKPVKKRWPDIERAVQMSDGAQERMKQAAAIRDQVNAQIEWGRADNHANLPLVLEQVFGLEDPEEYFFQRAAERLQRQAEMTELAQKDPVAHHRALERQFRERSEAKQKWQQQQAQRQQQQAERQAKSREREGVLRNELKSAGVAISPHTLARAAYIEREYREQFGIELEPRQAAYELRKQLDNEILGHLDAMPPEKLLQFLGEKRRTALRDAETAATMAARKQQRAASNGAAANGSGKSEGDKQMDNVLRNIMRRA